jgi:hypothetical protein
MFSIQRNSYGREILAITSTIGAKFIVEEKASRGLIPIGSVEYCQENFGAHSIDFYPEFLKSFVTRSMRKVFGPINLASFTRKFVFAKDAKTWKSKIPAKVYAPHEIVPEGEWWISEVVDFFQEWRYYVANGELITTGWYSGHDEDEPAPELNIEWPKGFSGAVDFGRLCNGQIELIECHAPFACGHYAENHADYVRWLVESWKDKGWWLKK